MKKRIFTQLVLIVMFFGLFIGVANSQEALFADKFKEYQENMNKYTKVHEEYVLAKSQYLKFDTLKSQNEAFAATLNLLQVRDDVVITYLESLRARLNGVGGLEEQITSDIVFQVDEEIRWFREHKARLPSSGDLEDLVEDSDEAEDRWENDAELIYKILAYIPAGRLQLLRNKLGLLNTRINEKVKLIKNEEREEYKFDNEKINIIDQWLFESENRVIRVDNKQDEAVEIIATIGEKKAREQSGYNSAVDILRDSLQHLKEARKLSNEVIKEIKRVR
jgi:hypothetical protein